MRLAAIDIGTNTTRLLVAEVDGPNLEVVERRLEVTRLGEGVDLGRVLSDLARRRTALVAAFYVAAARGAGAVRTVVAATSAVRDASNRQEFVDELRELSGVELTILDGAEEGRLTFAGATSPLSPGSYVVVDIGGGSTETIVGSSEVEGVWSADIGSVRLRERCLKSDPPTEAEVAAAHEFVRDALHETDRNVSVDAGAGLIAVAGTATTLAALVLGLDEYDPGVVNATVLDIATVKSWRDRLLSMPVAEIVALPTMLPGRADIIASGVTILHGLMSHWGFESVTVSEADILEGLIRSLQ